MEIVNCTYCNKTIQTDWYHVCEDCRLEVTSLKKSKTNTEWKKYRRKVWKLTEQVAHKIPGIEKRGFRDHHIDHKISIWDGYKKSIPPEKIASLHNLRMLPHVENCLKGRKSEYL